MNPVDAVRLMVKHYPGGVEALAVLTGKSGETLRKEIAGAHGFKLGVADASTISEACIAIGAEHCHAYANAVASNCGGFVKLETSQASALHNLPVNTAHLLRECSDVVTAVATALQDGHLSPNERKAIEREISELLEALQRVQADVAGGART